jgi:hypothetical protein
MLMSMSEGRGLACIVGRLGAWHRRALSGFRSSIWIILQL